MHANYVQVVRRGRPQVQADAAIFDGRILSSSRALAEGLIDAVGFLPDAIDRARQLARTEAVTAVMYRRHGSPARSLYDTVPNRPLQPTMMSVNIPGLDRSKLPLFLYLWQVEPTLVRVSGG